MKYYQFEYKALIENEVVNEGKGLYYTDAEVNAEHVLETARRIAPNETAVIEIVSIFEIEKDAYFEAGGTNNENH